MRPEQILDMQADLLVRLTSNDRFKGYVRHVIAGGRDQDVNHGGLSSEQRKVGGACRID